MRVYVSPGDDGTSTYTSGGLDIFRLDERIGTVGFDWSDEFEGHCLYYCASASMNSDEEIPSLYWYHFGGWRLHAEGNLNNFWADPPESVISEGLIASWGWWDMTSASPIPVPVPIPAGLPLILRALARLGLMVRRRQKM
ncbi:hypothetical protein [Pseudorhodobacter aquimaris]|uniref:hypothetical protein n=1 Tax=Pseudorhodobacter aquimaris TaxID=687412 RepID=UPI0012ED8691|nr:hypothetical protein [Pseudorhodobacter aquimaris]